MKHELNAITMKKAENPACLFEKISGLENCYNTSSFCILLHDQIATELGKALVEYSTVLTCEHKSKGGALTMLDLEEAMSQLYSTMYGIDGTNNGEREIGLLTSNDFVCYGCVKKGHKSYQYTLKKSKKKCKFSGKKGHAGSVCYDNPNNTSQAPK
eukprot:3957965-Ditylum_brightwellii.AAC.1